MNTVLVLMSTYNGELYLREQLDSILFQKEINVLLLIRDDGSTDSTCLILREYSDKYTSVEYFEGENVGFICSFSKLIERAVNYKEGINYYAFADQDDIWFKEKLHQACLILQSKDDSKPNLFTSNSKLIDSRGNVIGVFHRENPSYRKGNILVYCTEQGCSMVFNRKALIMYDNILPQKSFHDRYLYMICFYFGSVTYYHSPLFFYRLHDKNALGISCEIVKDGLAHKLYRQLKSFVTRKPMSNHRIMASEFLNNYGGGLTKEDRIIVETYVRYNKGFWGRLKLLNKTYEPPFFKYFSVWTKIIHILNVLFLKY